VRSQYQRAREAITSFRDGLIVLSPGLIALFLSVAYSLRLQVDEAFMPAPLRQVH
jgi:hypothetical protein